MLISILGIENKGKTFILEKIRKELRSGDAINKKGLNFKDNPIENQNCVIIDNA